MISPHRPKRGRWLLSVILVLLVCGAVLLLSLNRALIEGPVAALLMPFERGGSFVRSGLWNVFGPFRLKSLLQKENEMLRRSLAAQSLELLSHRNTVRENDELKAMLGRSVGKQTVVAAVLAKPPVSPYDTLLIDAGEKQGVSLGNDVRVSTFRIGRVEAVFPHEAKVVLLSAPGETTTVFLGEARVQATAVGRGGGNFETEVPRDVALAVGDPVLLPGIEHAMLGAIDEIQVRPTDSLQKVLFRLPVNFFQLDLVEVVL